MEWLEGWLQQIVTLVLVATFIHLLLPNNSMERYVKLVMGLLIILAILSPIFHLLSDELDLSRLAFTGDTPLDSKTMAPLYQIKEKSEQLKRTQGQLVEKQTAYAIEQMMTQQVNQKFPVEVMEAKVTIEETPEHLTQIKQVMLTAKMKQEDVTSEEQSMEPVHPVEPVKINPIGSQAVSSQTNQPDVLSATLHDLTNRITKDLAQTWNVKPDHIQLHLETSS